MKKILYFLCLGTMSILVYGIFYSITRYQYISRTEIASLAEEKIAKVKNDTVFYNQQVYIIPNLERKNQYKFEIVYILLDNEKILLSGRQNILLKKRMHKDIGNIVKQEKKVHIKNEKKKTKKEKQQEIINKIIS